VLQLPAYAFIGLAMLVISEVGMFARIEPFWSWHTAIAWTGYILLIDGIIYKKRGSSWLTANRGEFWLLAVVSIPLWLVFEFYNLLIRNWYYVNLPVNPIARYFGYAWAFATIWPAIFETADLVGVVRRPGARSDSPKPGAISPPTRDDRRWTIDDGRWTGLVILGAAMLIWPFVWPSPYLAAPVWLGFIFLLDPLNNRAAGESLIADVRRGFWGRITNLIFAGLICGVLWEFWNYWARAKWIYTVPIMPEWKIFEMPLPGYFGFPVFALECFTMYVFVRRFLWRGRVRSIGLPA
jgi:hypothetical protein